MIFNTLKSYTLARTFINKKLKTKMTSSGLTLEEGIVTALKDVAAGIAKTALSVGPNIMVIGAGVFGVFFILNKIPGWFKRFLG